MASISCSGMQPAFSGTLRILQPSDVACGCLTRRLTCSTAPSLGSRLCVSGRYAGDLFRAKPLRRKMPAPAEGMTPMLRQGGNVGIARANVSLSGFRGQFLSGLISQPLSEKTAVAVPAYVTKCDGLERTRTLGDVGGGVRMVGSGSINVGSAAAREMF